ncbi:MAG: Histidine kinase/response regulator hybrid protein [uncultured Sphingosinicella sp.]|uniref:histidine kinase n=1 Tax=uncultured Sphingosinicella sp. TaxID=478748 RepID=A0A6J4UFQ5_9SPHN|nr:PAS domain S-box protein [uncultured Sphingosinicella sp.]CAA9549510.1 MAG: Histidine kinase/response regulator hybrid protein [uncultured Sphingosinicella sp.]
MPTSNLHLDDSLPVPTAAPNDGAYVLDRMWRILDINEPALHHLGVSRSQATGSTLWSLAPRLIGTDCERYYRSAMDSRTVQEFVGPSAADEGRWLDVRVFPVPEGLAVHLRDITHRVQLEAKLRDREQLLSAIFGQASAGLAQVDLEGRFELVNDAYCAITGYSREQLLILRMQEITHPDDLAGNLEQLKEALAGKNSFTVEKRYVRPDGSIVWVNNSVTVLKKDAGEPIGILAVTTDRTEARRAEEQLRESEARYRQIVQGAEDFAIVTLDSRGLITGWNSGAERITDFPEAEAIGQPGAIIFTAEDRAAGAPEDELRRARADGRAVNERWQVARDGSRFWASGLTMLLDEEAGGFLKIFRDRTSEHQAEARRGGLVELGDALRDLQDPAEVAFAAAKILGRILGVSRVGYAGTDHDAETLHVERDWTAPSVETLAGVISLRNYGSYIDDLKRGEYTIISDVREDPRTTGTAEALEARSARSFVNAPVIERGRLVAMFFVNHAEPRQWSESDLTLIREFADRTRTAVERARGERALRELNETLEAQVAARSAERDRLWNLSQDMLAQADYSGMMSAVSPAWTRILGWSEADLLTRPYATFMHPDDMPPTLEAISRMAETRLPTRFENRISTREGGWKHIEWTVAPEPDGMNFIAVGRDISLAKTREAELEAAQEALRQSQKMEAMGSLTGGVAHDFNNLLTPIIGSLDMLVRKGVGSERERRLIDGALQSAERAKTLVQRLLAFARRQPLQPTAVDAARLVESMAGLIDSTVGPTIDVRVEVGADLPPAKADLNQLEMALLNLAVNARDAMPDGGELVIAAKRDSVRPQHPSGLKPGHYVQLSVRDTGIGMDEATQRRAVEPFFSTKGIGKGTGLGLSMVHGLAAQLGGGLTIASAPGAGTTISLFLPISAGPIGSDEEAPIAPDVPIGRGTALLVDDEELVRMSTADMLNDLGFDVVEAGSAEDAMRLLKAGRKPDLLVTDHLMPGMSGAELAQEARALHPALPILVVSGYADVEGIAPDLPRLTKPFRNADLAASLSALLTQEAH